MTDAPAPPLEQLDPSADEPATYSMRLSRLTIDKLGVKLYDRASAVVAELIANGYDADATQVTVRLPLGTELATKDSDGTITDKGFEVSVQDNGHGMTPSEAQNYFLVIGADRRTRGVGGSRSREKDRPVMGRKGIGKLAPFGICKTIEVRSAGGPKTENGYRVSHFILDFGKLLSEADAPETSDHAVPIDPGSDDKTWDMNRGTTVTLKNFLPKRVPAKETFTRQVARRFALARDDFKIVIEDSRQSQTFDVPKFDVPINDATKIDIDSRPVPFGDANLPVTGWLAFGKQAFKDEEEAGVRIYSRGKIVAATRDFEQPAGFTGEFTARSYLVGEVHAEWLDEDTGEDLVRTDRQGILWDSEYGEALRAWGAALIKEIAKRSAGPRRESKSQMFMDRSNLKAKAAERYGNNKAVLDAVEDFGKKLGGFASEDELGDDDYVDSLADLVLMTGPHQALIRSFQAITKLEDKSVDDLLPLFRHTRTAEMASYAQIASERVASITELSKVVDKDAVVEGDLQALIARAPWLIRPDWSVISQNQALKTFRDRFIKFWKDTYDETIEIAVTFEKKRPDFTLVHLGNVLHIVELKKPKHAFGDDDYGRLENYLEAFETFWKDHPQIAASFPGGWVIDLIADSVNIKDTTARRAFRAAEERKQVIRVGWDDFIHNAEVAHAEFLAAHKQAVSELEESAED